MFTKLLLASSAFGALSAPVANYQHTTQEGNVNITYQYETNEVNSIEDLVVGNIYHCDIPQNESLNLSDLGFNVQFNFAIVNNSLFISSVEFASIDEILPPIEIAPNQYCITTFYSEDLYIYSSNGDTYIAYYVEGMGTIYGSFDFIFDGFDILDENYDFSLINYISASDYNVITDVQEVYHTGLFGNLADFLRYHVYGGIPHINEITFDIGGNTTTMLDWLVITTSIALAVVSIFLLFALFRWIVKVFSNAFLLR